MIVISNIVSICMTKWLNCPLSNYVYIWFKSDFRPKSFCNALTVKFYFFYKKGVPLPCRFDVYDLNGNKAISVEEFLNATKGFTKMDRKILFERLDRNGEISMQ